MAMPPWAAARRRAVRVASLEHMGREGNRGGHGEGEHPERGGRGCLPVGFVVTSAPRGGLSDRRSP